MQKVKLGDIVQYREWKLGDLDIESVPVDSRSWGSTGLVISIGKSIFKLGILEDSVEYIDSQGDIYTARIEDLSVLDH